MKKKHSFFADTKQQVDQINRKNVANFDKPFFAAFSKYLRKFKVFFSIFVINCLNFDQFLIKKSMKKMLIISLFDSRLKIDENFSSL